MGALLDDEQDLMSTARRIRPHEARAIRTARRVALGVLATLAVSAFSGACTRKPVDAAPDAAASVAPSASSPLAEPSAEDPDPDAGPEDDESALDAAIGDALPDAYAKFSSLPTPTVQFNGPHKIASKAMQAWIHLYPDDETPFLGYVRAGTAIDRSEQPVLKSKRCPKGWYEVLPRGYLCDGRRATTDLDDPVVVASWKKPQRGEALPYKYVRPTGDKTWLYFKLPSKKDQRRTEGAAWAAHVANHPTSRLTNLAQLGEPEPIPEFLAGKEMPTPFGATRHLRYNVHEGRANPSGAFALLSVHDYEGRLFGLSTELDLLAIDRTDIVKPPPPRGGPVEDLPAGIVRSLGTPRYKIEEDGSHRKDGEFERFRVVDLTGKTHDDLWETRGGDWISGGAIDQVEPRTSFPSFADEGRKWIDVSIKAQLLVAYIGKRAVYVARVSTGLGEMSDPTKTFATVRGAFTIKSKHVTATMKGSAQADDYELADVPYVQYFHEGYALHGAFWHNNFGRVQSHGCVNLSPSDAAWLFEFTDPVVPPEWHGANSSNEAPGTVVYVRY